jgi:quinol monooxygenase YgiN
MYGSIMRARVKPGQLDALVRQFEQNRERITRMAGFVSMEFGQEDKDPNRVVGIIHFKDKASYVRNAEAPETDANYREMLKHLEGEPEWIDLQYKRYFGQPLTEGAAAGTSSSKA